MNAAAADAGIVLRLRARLFSRLLLSRFTRESKRAAPYRLVALLLLGGTVLFLIGITLGHLLIVAFTGHSLRPFLFPAFVWGPTAATVGIFFYAVLSLTATFTARSDLTLLMLTPLPPRLVLADRLLAVCAGFSVLMMIVALPDLIGAGQALHAGSGFVLVAVVVILTVPVPAAALAMLLAVLVLRWVPPARARAGSAIAGSVVAAALYTGAQALGDVQVSFLGGTVHVVPATWPGRALIAAVDGQTAVSLLYLGAFVALALGLALLAVDRASYLLASGWTVYGEIGRRRYGARLRAGVARRSRVRLLLPVWWPVVRKEWLTLRRDPKLLAQLAYPLLLEGYSFYHAFGNPFTAHAVAGRVARFLAATLYLTSSMTALFLLSVLALPIVGREGRSLYLLGLAPIRTGYLLLAKVLFCVVPVAVLLETLLLTAVTRLLAMTAFQTLYVAAVLLALIAALGSWQVCVGLLWPRLTSDGSRRQVHGTALLVGPITGGGLCMVVGFLLAGSFTSHPGATWAPIGSGLTIFVLTGGVIAAVGIAGPGILRDLLVGDRRPV